MFLSLGWLKIMSIIFQAGHYFLFLLYTNSVFFNTWHIAYWCVWLLSYLRCHSIFMVTTISVYTSSCYIGGYNYFRAYVVPPRLQHNGSTFFVTNYYIRVCIFCLLNGIDIVHIFNSLVYCKIFSIGKIGFCVQSMYYFSPFVCSSQFSKIYPLRKSMLV